MLVELFDSLVRMVDCTVMNIDGKTIIVTGASAGIGAAVVQELARHKARLVLAARRLDQLESVASELSCETLIVRTDVSDPNDLQNLVNQTLEHFGQIDVLVNNAGIDCFHRFETLDTDQILSVLETNLTGSILLTRAVIPHMLQQQSGCVINMASTAGKHCPAFGTVYGTTKAALIAFSEGLRGEYLGRGITSTAICPGFTKDGGIYDRIVQSTGKKVGPALGSTTARKVAQAVVKAIQKSPPEILVNWPPVRPVMVLKQLWPRLGEFLILKPTRKFCRRVAEYNASQASDND